MLKKWRQENAASKKTKRYCKKVVKKWNKKEENVKRAQKCQSKIVHNVKSDKKIVHIVDNEQ